jgi:hypothetical protein
MKKMNLSTAFRACFLVLFFLLTACGAEERYNTQTDAPENLIAKEKFVSILTDILLTETYVNNNQNRSEPPFKLYRAFEMGIFERHKTDTAQFFDNFEYYYGNSQIAEYINIMLMDSLQKRRDAYFGDKKDSISVKK